MAENRYFFKEITKFRQKIVLPVNSAKKTHVFRKGMSFLRILRKRRTFSERGRHVCEFCEKGNRFPMVEFVAFPKKSLKFNDNHTNSLNVHEKHTFSEKGCHVCEFCENDVRFPWVELVVFLKIGPRT